MKIFQRIKNKQIIVFQGLLLFCTLLTQSCSPTTQSLALSGHVTRAKTNERCVGGATFENEIVDCAGARIGLSCQGDDEHQPPVLILKNASVKNLIVAADGGSNGIQCISGDCVLDNVVWEDICEDAAALIKKGKSMTIRGGWAFNSVDGVGGKPDKIFQHNAGPGSTFIITDGFTARGVNGKLWRSCGNCKKNSGPRHLIVNDVRIEGEIHAIAGLNVNEPYNDTVTISHLSIENYRPKKTKICRTFIGSTREDAAMDAESLGEEWNTKHCKVKRSDIISF
jgi:hypothetical protein